MDEDKLQEYLAEFESKFDKFFFTPAFTKRYYSLLKDVENLKAILEREGLSKKVEEIIDRYYI